MLSNVVLVEYTTLDYIDSLALSNEQPTSIDADYDANIDSGVAHWAVWDDDTVPAGAQDIIDAVGAVDSGQATITATGAQTTITPAVADTEAESYRFYIAWKSGADESLVYSVSFGASGRSMADDYFQARRTYFSPRRRVARAPRKQRPPIPRIY